MDYSIATSSPDETRQLAARLAASLRGGDVIELASDLGGGKTTFVQGLALALGYGGRVASPTFTLLNVYRLPDGREIRHLDLYRLGEGGVVGEELVEALAEPHVITVIEWAGVIEAGLPSDRLKVAIEATGENDRKLVISAHGDRSRVAVEGLTR